MFDNSYNQIEWEVLCILHKYSESSQAWMNNFFGFTDVKSPFTFNWDEERKEGGGRNESLHY
jgi:hypothetical protein